MREFTFHSLHTTFLKAFEVAASYDNDLRYNVRLEMTAFFSGHFSETFSILTLHCDVINVRIWIFGKEHFLGVKAFTVSFCFLIFYRRV